MPKKSQPNKISKFRPINLVTSLYKIIAKILSGRIRRFQHEAIYISQEVFVKRRQIVNFVLIVNKMEGEKRSSREEREVFKIDFEKAYNHVDCGFIGSFTRAKRV